MPSTRSLVSRTTSTGLPSAGRLLLDAARVGDHELAARQQARELGVAHRLAQQRRCSRSESSGRRLSLHARVRVQRQHERDVGVRRREACDALADPAQALAPVLAAVRRDQHDPAIARRTRVCTAGSANGTSSSEAQRSASIAVLPVTKTCLIGMFSRTRFSWFVVVGARWRRGDARDQAAVELLGERRAVAGAGAQAGLDVDDRDAQVEGGDRGRRAPSWCRRARRPRAGTRPATPPRGAAVGGPVAEPLAAEIVEAQHHGRHALVQPRVRSPAHSVTSAPIPASLKTSRTIWSCCPVVTTIGLNDPLAFSARMIGSSLIASGRVPTISVIASLPFSCHPAPAIREP